MTQSSLKPYRYNGARALVLLHEKYLRACLETWREAKRLNITLPQTDDQDYQSLESLLRHILRAARGYMTWMCENLGLPDPGIDPAPESVRVEAEAESYITHLLQKWRLPLADLPEDKFHAPAYTSRWGVAYCIDAMLEHAVMHPIRHEFQLRNLISSQKK